MNNYKNFYEILKGQYSTEKTVYISDKFNGITFKVLKKSNKYEIKNAVEKLFKVSVISVKTINIKSKNVKFKGFSGKTKSWKKAIVFLKKGDVINFSEIN